ncbi:MAG: sarcosine oxidase subunit alpha family protein [Hyphomicrobiales bacterium]
MDDRLAQPSPRVDTASPPVDLPQPFRLPSGGLIDRSRSLSFTFDCRQLAGHPGDTLASALVANGVKLVGRSFKYHRPRGILSAGPEEPNALVELRSGARREPNTRASAAELYDGLEAQSQNRWPSLAFDVMAVNSVLSPILTAGFYYKTFMWPASFWEKLYEPLIRRAAGLGQAPEGIDPDHYEKAHGFCDVLVIGSGPAGLMAALSAARSGARVILCEEDFRLGGRLLMERRAVGDQAPMDFVERIAAELRAMPDVRVMTRTTVFGVYDHGVYGAVERVNDHLPVPPPFEPRQRAWRIVAKRCVLAAGAIERPLVFGNNDRPGVMLAGAVRTYVKRFAALPGRRAVIFGNNDDAAGLIADLTGAGVAVEALVDPRAEIATPLRRAAEAAGARIMAGGVVTRAIGGRSVHAVEIRGAGGRRSRIACDLVAMSGGFSPSLHLSTHLGARPVWDETIAAFVPGAAPPGMAVAGAASGVYDLAACLAVGAGAGAEAASAAGFQTRPAAIPVVEPDGAAVTPLWRVRGHRGKAFIDFQNDVTDKDVELAEREGFRSVEHLKRYTTLGMATDQGKTANVNGLALMAEITERSIPQTGVTTFRPPFTPVAIGALAGHARGKEHRPTRLTPSHDWARQQGAVFVESGLWLRAQYFPKEGDRGWFDACNREVNAVRSRLGICDVSTLGKIDIQGADAAEFLNRLYCNSWKSLAVGKVRYGLMLREDGFVFDDGTTARLGSDHYLMTTTTANAAAVMQHLDFCHQVLWPELDVGFVSVTEQWAQYAIAGPKSRELLQAIVDRQHDISNDAFPYMACGEVTILGGLRARLFRISFSGELAYELGVPCRYGDAVIRALMQAGAPFGIAPYGLEALNVMRIEKGHVSGGELNGLTTAHDLGLGRMMAMGKDFIGRALSQREALIETERPSLVGFQPVDPSARLSSGAHFIGLDAEPTPENDEGYMTSVAFSPSLNLSIGLGLLKRGRERLGEVVRAHDALRGTDIRVKICPTCFLDREGTRLRG